MVCKNCGRELPEGSVFCDNCGVRQVEPVEAAPAPATVAAPAPTAAPAPAPTPAPAPAPAPVVNNYYQAEKRSMSVAGYIGRSLIPCIPVVGTLIYFILLFVWSGNSSMEDSFRNWAKAQLWCMLIGIILVVVVALIVVAIILNIQSVASSSYSGAYYAVS